MKNKSLVLSALLMLAVSSCSSIQPKDERKVASKDFECNFSQMVDGKKTMFIFTPEALKLSLTNEKGNEVIFLEEDNFLSGGFSYVMDKNQKSKEWPVKKVEFSSFAEKPTVTVSCKRTPASKIEKTYTSYCE